MTPSSLRTPLSFRHTNHQEFHSPRGLALSMAAGLMDVISRQDSGRGRSPERTLCTVLFKICFNALFSLSVPVDLVFYLICPKHTSLMGAAGCVRGSASLPPGGQQGATDRTRQRHLYTCCTHTPTHPRAPTLAYIFINAGGILGEKNQNKKNHNRLRNETIMGPQGVPLFVLTQRTSYAN